jgi:hypothetical protein
MAWKIGKDANKNVSNFRAYPVDPSGAYRENGYDIRYGYARIISGILRNGRGEGSKFGHARSVWSYNAAFRLRGV